MRDCCESETRLDVRAVEVATRFSRSGTIEVNMERRCDRCGALGTIPVVDSVNSHSHACIGCTERTLDALHVEPCEQQATRGA